eukprot:UN23182
MSFQCLILSKIDHNETEKNTMNVCLFYASRPFCTTQPFSCQTSGMSLSFFSSTQKKQMSLISRSILFFALTFSGYKRLNYTMPKKVTSIGTVSSTFLLLSELFDTVIGFLSFGESVSIDIANAFFNSSSISESSLLLLLLVLVFVFVFGFVLVSIIDASKACSNCKSTLPKPLRLLF